MGGHLFGGTPQFDSQPPAPGQPDRSVSPDGCRQAHLALETDRNAQELCGCDCYLRVVMLTFVLSDFRDISMRRCGGNINAVLRGRKTTFNTVFRVGSGQNSDSVAFQEPL